MITIAKLQTLKPRTCVRKIANLFHEFAVHPDAVDPDYLVLLVALLGAEPCSLVLSDDVRFRAAVLAGRLGERSSPMFTVACEDLHYLLLEALGAEPADWDFVDDVSGALDVSRRLVLPHTLVLDRIRSPFNVGALFRSADSFGVREVLLVEGTASPDHPRARRTARGCTETVPWRIVGEQALLAELEASLRPMFALELGGVAIQRFSFPSDGVAVLGSEEMGVSPAFLAACDRSAGRVAIPLSGTKGSLNVAVAGGIMLHSWLG